MSRTRGTRKSDRDSILDAAVRDGKIAAASRDQYCQMYDANPDAIRRLLTVPVEQGGLMPGLVGSGENAAVAADAYDESWLTPAERSAVAARRTPPATPAAPAPPAQASAPPEDADEYDSTWLSAEERSRIEAARTGQQLDAGPVQFEDGEARRAATTGGMRP